MSPERYRRAGGLYHAALALSPERRAAFLEQSCSGDLDLLADVQSLLAAHGETERFDDGSPGAIDESLTPGQRLGRYQVLDLLGAGGMGRVYCALDPSLGREVAIKALALTFRGDAASLRRFEREARALATLSHPNIATIYGFEELDGAPYLVLERVDGETLADRLRRGAVPVDAARDLAVQIAAGLEEAHGKGVVHRDLKPSNVMVTPDGRVKLVDFGLAKTAAPDEALDPSADPITSPGVVLGTARYMSPEQVRGSSVDTRTDVWAFGCVLYEMLTGQPVFDGRSVSEVVAAVLRDDPDWQALPADTPRAVNRLLRRCLRRDPRMRLQHIGDARLELLDGGEVEPVDVAAGAGLAIARRKARWGVTAAAAAIAALGAFLLLRSPSTVPTPGLTRLSLELPEHAALAADFTAPFAIAPAGAPVVLEAIEGTTRRLYVRELADPALRPLAGSEDARQPFFSADGAWVGFFANRKLSKMPIAGGPVLHIADTGGNPRGAAWAADGTIVFAAPQTAGLSRVQDSGGKPVPLTTLDTARGEASHRWPDMLPGGKWVLFTVGFQDASYDEGRIEAVSLETGERRVLVSGAGFARYVPDGRLLFVRGGRLHIVGIDPAQLVVRGTPDVVLDPIRYDFRNGGAHLSVSAAGALVYGPGEPISSEYFLAWVDRDGRLARASDAPRPFRNVKVSPDGRRIATVIGTAAESDLWVMDANATLSRLTFSLAPHRPTWTARGDAITIGAEKAGSWRLMTIAFDGKGDPMVLFESPHRLYPNAWSPDGRHLIFQESRPDTGWDLRVLDVDTSGRPVGAPRAFVDSPFEETNAAISPDGRWVSYESNELDGVFQVYARSYPDGAHKVRVSPAGARWPTWDAQGRLYYWQTTDDTLWAAETTERDGRLLVGRREPAWSGGIDATVLKRIVNPVAGARYDLGSDGTRFLVLETTSERTAPAFVNPIVVLGWRNAASGPSR